MVAAAFIWPFSSRGKGELRAGAYSCTCPPRAVWSSLSGGGTRTRRQQRSTKHQGPGTTQRTTASTGTDQTRLAPAGRRECQQARRGFFSFSFYDGANLLFSFPSTAGRGNRSEGLSSGLDEGRNPIWLDVAAPEVVMASIVREKQVDSTVAQFLNRLSDYLFTVARRAAVNEGREERIYRRPRT
uniref:Cobalamin adenosyltransferase-like domain-containing protein n=1 Tax=Eptatretus burgeri TaxID=7764 RepID=A0A8C4R440_EPTBU